MVGHGDELGVKLFLICHLVGSVVIETEVEQSLVQELDAHLTWNGNGRGAQQNNIGGGGAWFQR